MMTVETGGRILSWWMENQYAEGTVIRAFARMRHARTPLDVYHSDRAVAQLHTILGPEVSQELVGAVAGVLCDIRSNDHAPIPRRLAEQSMSVFRFRQLMSVTTTEELMSMFRTVVRLLNHRARVVGMAFAMMDWNDEDRGHERRRRWAYGLRHAKA